MKRNLSNLKHKLKHFFSFLPSSKTNYKLETNQELLILMLASSPIFYGDVKLAKCLYMIMSELHHNKSIKNPFKYQFHRWDYGPHDPKVYWDLAQLSRHGFIEVTYEPRGKNIKLTTLALSKLAALSSKYEKATIDCINQWVCLYNKKNTDEVIKDVFSRANVSDYELGERMPLVNLTA